MRYALPILFTAALLIGAASAPSLADEDRIISVQGTGSAAAKPDMANVQAGVETRGNSAEAALAANTKAMNSLFVAIKKHGIAERDIQTTSFNVNPIYTQPGPRGNGGNAPTIDGYQVTNQVSVQVRDLAKLGGLLSALVDSGANRLHGVSFEIAEPAPLMDAARRAAVADARKRADAYAEAAGVTIKRVQSISEFSAPRPMPMVRAMKAEMAADVPIATGEQSLSVGVNVIYEIE